MNALAAIHVARKQLGLDEDTYRALALRVTGESSAGAMTEIQRGKLLEELRRQGFNYARKSLEGPFARKLQALWISAHHLGVVRDRSDAALLSFVKRQAHVDHTRFLLDGTEAAKVVDALKAWMTRDAGVDWSLKPYMAAWQRLPGAKVALAQWALLAEAGTVEASFGAFQTFVQDHAFNPIDRMTAREWAGIVKTLGRRVRKAVR